jgi:hypothetical protein
MNETTPNTTATGGAAPSSCGDAAAAGGWRGVLPVIAAGMSADLLDDVGVTVGGVTIHADECSARLALAGGAADLDPRAVAALHAVLGGMLAAWDAAA